MDNEPVTNAPPRGLKFWRMLVAAGCLMGGLLVVRLSFLPAPGEGVADAPAPNRLWGIGYAVVPMLMMALGHVEDYLARKVLKTALWGMLVLDALVAAVSLMIVLFGRDVQHVVPTALTLAGAMLMHALACYGVLKVVAWGERHA